MTHKNETADVIGVKMFNFPGKIGDEKKNRT